MPFQLVEGIKLHKITVACNQMSGSSDIRLPIDLMLLRQTRTAGDSAALGRSGISQVVSGRSRNSCPN